VPHICEINTHGDPGQSCHQAFEARRGSQSLLLINKHPRPPSGWYCVGTAVVLWCCCAGTAVVLRLSLRARSWKWAFRVGGAQKRCPWFAPGTSRTHLFKMRISPQRERHFASKHSPFPLFFLHIRFSYFISYKRSAKRSFWSKTLKASSSLCLF
jgi:hypothetical protein